MWSNQQALAPGAFNRRHGQRLLQWVKTGLHGLRLPLPDGNASLPQPHGPGVWLVLASFFP